MFCLVTSARVAITRGAPFSMVAVDCSTLISAFGLLSMIANVAVSRSLRGSLFLMVSKRRLREAGEPRSTETT